MADHRIGSYGQTIRVNIGIDMSQFTGQTGRDITCVISAASGVYSSEFNFSASTLFIGSLHSQHHLYLGLVIASGPLPGDSRRTLEQMGT